jgi:TonB family protein
MSSPSSSHWALGLSVALHIAALSAVVLMATPGAPPAQDEDIAFVELVAPPPPSPPPPAAAPPTARSAPPPPDMPAVPVPDISTAPPELLNKPYREAPPAPSAQEWAAAASYTLKNSKRYRHTWGQQVRSAMGTAFDGPDQGVVRFRVVIAPNGRLSQLETLWTTSPMAERLARQAIERMPPLPPTPNGQPLIFEKTINFDARTPDIPPVYKDDCLPDPPQRRNPYAWDGKSAQSPATQPISEKLDPAAYADCLKQLPQDSMDAEIMHDQRQLERWGSHKLKP